MQKNGKIISCDKCGKEFYLCKSKIQKYKNHFCSKSCFDKFERPTSNNIKSKYRFIKREGRRISEHRYVMEKYLGRKLRREECVHHKNKNTLDNSIENLEIVTSLEHNRIHKEKLPKTKICIECGKVFFPPIKHRKRNVLCSKECWSIHQKKVSPFKGKKILCFKNGIKIKEYNSIKEASLEINGLSTNIVKCLKGITKSAYGYQWEYDK